MRASNSTASPSQMDFGDDAGSSTFSNMNSVAQEVQALGSALNSLHSTITEAVDSGANHADTATQSSPPAPRGRTVRQRSRSSPTLLSGPSCAATESNPPPPVILPAAQRMDTLMVETIKDLPLPHSLKRFLNFDRPLW